MEITNKIKILCHTKSFATGVSNFVFLQLFLKVETVRSTFPAITNYRVCLFVCVFKRVECRALNEHTKIPACLANLIEF